MFPGGGKPYGIEYQPLLVLSSARPVSTSNFKTTGMSSTDYYWCGDGNGINRINSDLYSSRYFKYDSEYKILRKSKLYLRTNVAGYRDSYYTNYVVTLSSPYVHYSSIVYPGDIVQLYICCPYSLSAFRDAKSSSYYSHYACALPRLYINGSIVYDYSGLLGYIGTSYDSAYTSEQAKNLELPEKNYPFTTYMNTANSSWYSYRSQIGATAYFEAI